jgi:hypothetical protein
MLLYIAAGSGIVCLAATLIASLRLVAVYRRLPEYFPQQIGWDGDLIGIGSRRSFTLLYALFGLAYLGAILNDASIAFFAGPDALQNTSVVLALLFTIALATLSVLMLVNTAAVTQNAVGRPPTAVQRAIFRWAFRGSLGVMLGIVFEMLVASARLS